MLWKNLQKISSSTKELFVTKCDKIIGTQNYTSAIDAHCTEEQFLVIQLASGELT